MAPLSAFVRRNLRHLSASAAASASAGDSPLSSTHAFSPTLRRLVRSGDLPAITSLLEPLRRPPHPQTEPHLSSVASSYASSGMLDSALSVLSSIPSPSSLSLNSLLSSLTHHPSLYRSVPELFLSLPKSHPSIVPDHISFSLLIKSHCKSGNSALAIQTLKEMQSKNIPVTTITYTTILDSLFKEKKPQDAEKLWKEMKDKKLVLDAAAYNVRIMGKVLAKSKPETVLRIVQEMEENGLKPDTITYNYLIDCYCKNGRFEDAREVYEGLGEKGCEANYRTYKVYLMELCKKGDLDAGLEVFGDALKEKKVPDLGAVKILVEKLVKAKRMRAAKRVVTGLRKKFEKDFVGGWMELEKIVGLDKNDDDEEDEKAVEA